MLDLGFPRHGDYRHLLSFIVAFLRIFEGEEPDFGIVLYQPISYIQILIDLNYQASCVGLKRLFLPVPHSLHLVGLIFETRRRRILQNGFGLH